MQIRMKIEHRDVPDVVCGAVMETASEPQAIVTGYPLRGIYTLLASDVSVPPKLHGSWPRSFAKRD